MKLRAPKSERLYTAADVARELGISKMTVLRWVSNGGLRQPHLYMRKGRWKAWLWDTDEFSLALKKAHRR